jgi:FKBP-type peptidyl-prolyl cis-trans isomerase
MPETEEGKVFYALGVNIARQVGGELKPVLSPEELAIMINGFTDSINGKSGDEKALLTKYGPKLNDVLVARQNGAMDNESRKGLEFIKQYLTNNEKAINTASGLVYNEMVAGKGKQVSLMVN